MKAPLSTYRLQINADFRFSAVRELLDYFRDLGVGTLYFSPVFSARPHSPHGYDVTDPSRFSREAGDEAEFTELSRHAAERGLGILLDIVPNHMAASEENPWWCDVLEHGPASTSASFFDVDWAASGYQLVLPILGDSLEECIRKGEIRLELRHELPNIVYFARALPLDPRTYGIALEKAASLARGGTRRAARQLSKRAAALLERRPLPWPERIRRRAAAQELKQALRQHLADPAFLAAFAQALQHINHSPGELLALVEAQAYRLEFWRTGMERINYRRFFDIADLAGVRVEDRGVFEVTHALILELVLNGLIEGLRIDHIDGLRDPLAYLARLREAVGDTYIIVEKILAPGEDLRANWPVQGTTGYDYIGMTAGLFAHPDGLDALTDDYHRRTGLPSFTEIVNEKKKLVIKALFAGEAESLMQMLELTVRAIEPNCGCGCIRDALIEMTAALPVYRTYIRDEVTPEDRNIIKQALTTARHRAPHVPDVLFATLRRILLLDDLPAEYRGAALDFITVWQQFTGPVMAKGLEDTAFYTYHRLLSLSEVGSHPDQVGTSVTQFHENMTRRAQYWPFTMNASSTHDTKRSEDVRARIAVLSEMAPEWSAALDHWTAIAAEHRRTIDGTPVPGINEEILIFQTLLGVWPLDEAEEAGLNERMRTFLLKAAREAKHYSSWLDPNEEYEQALFAFVEDMLADARFVDDFRPFQQEVAYYGALNSISQIVLKLGAPGVPDIYQGNELWDFSLVDPDNRRPVDYTRRRALLSELMRHSESGTAFVRELMDAWPDGRIKLYLTWIGLQLRNQNPGLFLHGDYVPVYAQGPLADHVIAFARRYEERTVLFAATRFYRHLAPPMQLPVGRVWNDTRLQLPEGLPRSWQNLLTNESAEGDALTSYFSTLPFGIFAAR